jgi:hypothetical protein
MKKKILKITLDKWRHYFLHLKEIEDKEEKKKTEPL